MERRQNKEFKRGRVKLPYSRGVCLSLDNEINTRVYATCASRTQGETNECLTFNSRGSVGVCELYLVCIYHLSFYLIVSHLHNHTPFRNTSCSYTSQLLIIS
jgi:hypothetical protein